MQHSLKRSSQDTNIDIVFLLYWGVLVFWQNVNPGSTGSFADTAIKTALILMLVAYYLLHVSMINVRTLGVVFFLGGNLAISFLSESGVTLRNILTYFFPVVFAFLSCCTGGRFEIDKRKLLRFMRILIGIVSYMAIYAVVTKPEKFLNALSTSNAYGNELTSFFVSSHEYGMYLMAGIAACILCFELESKRTKMKNAILAICLVLFFVNLLLTYSRTAMLATALIVLPYMILNRHRRLPKAMLALFALVLLFVLLVPTLRQYTFDILLKGNNDAGRGELASLAMKAFREGNLPDKLWGQGATAMSAFFKEETSHSSAHNAYLQTMLYFGIVSLCIMICFLLSQLVANIRLARRNRTLGVLFAGLTLACASMMLTNTAVLFSSPIDSFFLTVFTILVPMYVRNALVNLRFWENETD